MLLGIQPGEPVPPGVRVLLNGPPDDPRSVLVHDDLEATLLAAWSHLDERHETPGRPRRVVVGLDPGSVIGMALLADGITYLVAEDRDPEQAAQRIARWAQGVEPIQSWDVHIGDGPREEALALVRAVRKHMPTARVALVSEEGTTPYSAQTTSRHTDAAIHIAMREPIAVGDEVGE